MRKRPTTARSPSSRPSCVYRWIVGGLHALVVAALALEAAAATNAPLVLSSPAAAAPNIGASLVRMAGALALVIALFLGGVWLVRNWHRLGPGRGRAARLSVLEVKPLGHRQALVVVGYEQQRMLLATSPAGISLVTHLAEAPDTETADKVPAASVSFTDVLQHLLPRKA